jgi:hypothetical protein
MFGMQSCRKICNVADSNLLRSAKASKLAYTDLYVRPWIKKEVDMYMRIDKSKTGAHAYLWKTGDKSLIISFRGTHDIKDVFNCIDIRQKKFAFREYNVGVHAGVMNMFESLEPHLTECFMENKVKSLTFCGHSLGGSIATLTAAYYGSLFNGNNHVACHTFGAPKVGDYGFQEWYEAGVNESRRVIMPGDFVTGLPPCNGLVHADESCVMLPPLQTMSNPFQLHDLDTYIDQLCVRKTCKDHHNL